MLEPSGKSAAFRYEVKPGVHLNVRDWGGNGPLMAILVHGVAEGGWVWDEFAPELVRRCRVLAVDLRGHGESDRGDAGTYTIDEFAEDLLRLVRGLEAKDVLLLGHSLGATVAARIAPEVADKLRALVLVDGGPGRNEETARALYEQLRESHRPYRRVQDYANWLKARRPFAPAAVLDRLAAKSLLRAEDGSFRLRFDVRVTDVMISGEDDSWWLPTLARLDAPVLVVRGVASACLTSRAAWQLRATAKRGELAVIPRAGHAVMNDNGEDFARAVLPFVERVSGSFGVSP